MALLYKQLEHGVEERILEEQLAFLMCVVVDSILEDVHERMALVLQVSLQLLRAYQKAQENVNIHLCNVVLHEERRVGLVESTAFYLHQLDELPSNQ